MLLQLFSISVTSNELLCNEKGQIFNNLLWTFS
jgi:hypothetical protein